MDDVFNDSRLSDLNSESLESVEESIVEQIFEAVIDQRLPPGTKLSESALCEAFGVSRMRIRRSLLLLASREVVEIVSNRGAYVASPTAKQARDVFEARLAIEPGVARLAARRRTSTDIAMLEAHLQKEVLAHDNGKRRDAIRLSGMFHVLIAQIADNGVMLRTIKELVARASLIIGVYGAPGVTSCRDDDHAELLTALKNGREDLAAQLMVSHLDSIRAHIDLETSATSPVDLAGLFGRS